MSGAETWIRALTQTEAPSHFSLSFARLGLTAECRSLSAPEISRALSRSGEAAARELLYLACPGLQQAGEAMAAEGMIARAADITLKLPYSDVLQAASLILRHSGGGAGMVSAAAAGTQPEESLSGEAALSVQAERVPGEPQMDGYALLRQWAAEDRAAGVPTAVEQHADPLSATLQLRQTWSRTDADAWHRAERQPEAITAEQVAWELCRRLQDAAGNM